MHLYAHNFLVGVCILAAKLLILKEQIKTYLYWKCNVTCGISSLVLLKSGLQNMLYKNHRTSFTAGLITTSFLSAGDREKARVREMLEIVPETTEGDQCSDGVAGSDRRGTDKEVGCAGHAKQLGCWNCLGQGNNMNITEKIDFFPDKNNFKIWHFSWWNLLNVLALSHLSVNAQKSLNRLVSAEINSTIHLHVAIIFTEMTINQPPSIHVNGDLLHHSTHG